MQLLGHESSSGKFLKPLKYLELLPQERRAPPSPQLSSQTVTAVGGCREPGQVLTGRGCRAPRAQGACAGSAGAGQHEGLW